MSSDETQLKPDDYTEVESILHDMFHENTGRHILDSGGVYGRHWEKRQKINDFRKQDPFTVEINKYGDNMSIDFEADLFSFLSAILDRDEYVEEFEDAFFEYANSNNDSWFENMQNFTHGEYDPVETINSYNDENYLSGVIQYTVFSINRDWIYDSDAIIGLTIHGGCDVRDGYTKPRFFRVNGDGPADLMDYSTLYGSCDCTIADSEECGYYWSYEKQYNWKDDKPKQTTIDDSIIDPWDDRSNDHKMPPHWEVVEKPDDAPEQYTGEYALRCKICGAYPGFNGRFELGC